MEVGAAAGLGVVHDSEAFYLEGGELRFYTGEAAAGVAELVLV